MSELILKLDETGYFRRQLLTTASALVLIGSLYGGDAAAEEPDHPTVWIELGGQLERMSRSEDRIAPPFALRTPRPDFETTSPISLLRPPRYAVGGEGKLSFEPGNAGLVFTAAIRYGRSNGKKHFHNQTYTPRPFPTRYNPDFMITPGLFEDAKTDYKESHTILDFMVGKDVGLGLFGKSLASLGVRYAQFGTDSTVSLSSKPDYVTRTHVPALFGKYATLHGFHNYQATSITHRSFHGVGPSLSLSGATTLIGNSEDGVTFDWGVNGAVLFGRQRTTAEHHTYGRYIHPSLTAGLINAVVDTYDHTHNRTASRSVTVPNIGGFAGFSVHYPNAKLSLGYRADTFFGAMDGGLDARKSYDRSFYGPFATISIGLGG